MTDILRFAQEDNLLSNVARMISDPFHALGNGHEMQGADNMIGMLQHGFGHLSLNGFVELVDLLVTKNDFARQIRFAIDKGV